MKSTEEQVKTDKKAHRDAAELKFIEREQAIIRERMYADLQYCDDCATARWWLKKQKPSRGEKQAGRFGKASHSDETMV